MLKTTLRSILAGHKKGRLVRGMRCPTCGAPVMVRKDSWECGYCCDCGNLPRPRIVLTVDVEEEPKLTIESLAENADPDTALLLRKFSEPLGAWDIDELSAMGAVEILERAYGEDHREGIAMWSALLYAAGSRLKAPREAKWLLHSCCPYGTDDLSTELLDELQRDEKLSRLVFQSAYVGEEQYHLIDAAAEFGRPELMAQCMALLGGNPLPRKKWEIPYPDFEALCAARSREAAKQEASHLSRG